MRKLGMLAAIPLSVTAAAKAQDVARDRAILAAAVEQVRSESDVAGAVAIDPRQVNVSDVAGSGEYAGRHAPETAAALAQAVGATVKTLDEAMVCSGAARRTCSLNGVAMVIAVSAPLVRGDTAEVGVTVRSRPPRNPTAQGSYVRDGVVTLIREGNRWVAKPMRISRIS